MVPTLSREVELDAVSVVTECLLLKSYSVSNPDLLPYVIPDYPNNRALAWYGNVSINLKFETCPEPITVKFRQGHEKADEYREHRATHWIFEDEYKPTDTVRQCAPLSQDQNWILYTTGSWGTSAQSESLPELEACSAVVCSVEAWISKVKVRDDGIRPNLTQLPESANNAVQVNTSVWHMITNMREFSIVGALWVKPTTNITGPVALDAMFNGEWTDEELLDADSQRLMYTSEELAQSIRRNAARFGTMSVHNHLRQTNQIPSPKFGYSISQIDRLQVSRGVCIAMAVLFGCYVAICSWLMFQSKAMSRLWHRDPATLLGLMAFFMASSKVRTGMIQQNSHVSKWTARNWSPLPFRPWAQGLFTAYVAALIIALACTLQESRKSNGLADVNEEALSLIMW